MLLNLNLAPLKYNSLIQWPNNIIKNIYHSQKEIRLGERGFETYITLQEDILPINYRYQLYGNHHGTGSDIFLNIAIYKGISEALERWAFQHCIDNNPARFGFIEDPTTDGMAAFPGLFKSQSREQAYNEAIERWALKNWWNDALPSRDYSFKYSNIFRTIEILTPFKNVKTVILCMKDIEEDFTIYSFAASASLKKAISKAQIELLRNLTIVKKYNALTDIQKTDITSTTEKRLLFFASPKGTQAFNAKVLSSQLKHTQNNKVPKVLFDDEIIGPWTKYSTVWRVVLESSILPSTNEDIFLF